MVHDDRAGGLLGMQLHLLRQFDADPDGSMSGRVAFSISLHPS